MFGRKKNLSKMWQFEEQSPDGKLWHVGVQAARINVEETIGLAFTSLDGSNDDPVPI